jgi:Ni/Fe-hydrogenase 1 B-type cytochrome subunit
MTTDALRRPTVPPLETVEPEPLRAVYVWELPVRLTHWLIAASILVLAVTGVYIGRPFLLAPGAAGERFVMGTVKAVHSWAAIVFTVSVLARIGWMFAGNRWASWREYLPFERHRRRDIPGTLSFYLFMRSLPPATTGHNPVAGLTYTLVFLLYFVQIATGLTLYAASAHVSSPVAVFSALAPLFGGLQSARWIHHVVMWLLIGFVVHHVQSSLLVSRAERNGLVDSILSGYKFLPRRSDERGGEP